MQYPINRPQDTELLIALVLHSRLYIAPHRLALSNAGGFSVWIAVNPRWEHAAKTQDHGSG
jgi:hypothetical protein